VKRRVVVTGVGAITPVGKTAPETWESVKNGVNGVDAITLFDASAMPAKIAAEIKGFDPLNYMDKKEARKVDRFVQFSFIASDEAMKMSGLQITPENAEGVGVAIGSGIGGLNMIEDVFKTLLERGPSRVTPFFIPGIIINMASGLVSIKYGAKGPNFATVSACATSAHSIGMSLRTIQYGDADVMICGGAEAAITPLAIAGFSAMRALSTRNDDPKTACRPYDLNRDGFVMGEGAGVLVLEELEFAKKRGAKIICELKGFGQSGDAYHISAPSDDGDGPMRVMKNVLKDSGLKAEEIDYINAHGTSTPQGDKVETLAVKRTFGEKAPPVSSTKSEIGHLLGAAGAVESIVSIYAMLNDTLPPTINIQTPDPDCDLDYVPDKTRPQKMRNVLSNSFGFGGTNACLVFSRFEE
jgi:3-oxoacyl-[acyl-carrier-protein] synthase II